MKTGFRKFGAFASTEESISPSPFPLVPVSLNFSTFPDGAVGQQTEYILDISGTPPFAAYLTAPVELTGRVTLVELPGGSQRFVGVPPAEGFTAQYVKSIGLEVWNAHPDTNAANPVTDTIEWMINPSAIDADWGTPGALPDAEVEVPYAFYASSVTGTPPYTFARTAGLTVAQLNAAGLNLRVASTANPAGDALIFGTPIAGSENTLGSSITLGVTGQSGVQDTNAFGAGIVIRRKPTLELQAIPTVTTGAGSFSFVQYLKGYPAAHIAVASGSSLPSGFSLGSDVLSWTGLTDSNNGTSADIVFDITNGYHTASTATLVISVQVPATGSIAFDTNSRNDRTATTDPLTISHAGAASSVKGVLMFALGLTTTPHVTGQTYDGVAVTEIDSRVGSTRVIETGFLGTSVAQGTKDAVFDFDSATTDDIECLVATILASGDLAVQDVDGLNDTGANSSVTLQTGGNLCQAYALIFCAVADLASITNGAGLTTIQEIDKGSSIWRLVRQTTPSTSDFTLGFTHASAARVLSAVAVKLAQVSGCPGSIASWNISGKANGAAISGLADEVEVVSLQDNASGLTIWTKEAGTSAAHDGPHLEKTGGTYLKLRDGNADVLASMGYEYVIGSVSYWVGLTVQVPDTQQAGERCLLTMGATRLYCERTGPTSIVFRIGSGALRVSATAVDAVTSAVRVVFYIVDANTAGICYSLGGTITYDSGNVSQAGIGQQFVRMMFNPSTLGPADDNVQAIAFGSGVLT